MTQENIAKFQKAFTIFATTGDKSQLKILYEIFDSNGDGYIDADEVGMVLKAFNGNEVP